MKSLRGAPPLGEYLPPTPYNLSSILRLSGIPYLRQPELASPLALPLQGAANYLTYRPRKKKREIRG